MKHKPDKFDIEKPQHDKAANDIMAKEDMAFIRAIEVEDKITASVKSNPGDYWYIDHIDHTQSNTTTVPIPYTITYPGTTTICPSPLVNPSPYSTTTVSTNKDKHCVFRLPESNIPNKVYVSGRLMTVGILGSDVQAAYAGGNKLIFAPNELDTIKYNGKLTVSLEYGKFLYHYNVEQNAWGVTLFEGDSTVVKAKLVSKVMQR